MTRRIYFARVNRRLDAVLQDSIGERRPFRHDMADLVDASPLRARVPRSAREWIAADLEWRGANDDFVVGMLGYVDEHTRRDFDEENGSWVKGNRWQAGGARDEALVPFAVDAREDRRYVAFATGGGLTQLQFLGGFKRAVNKAVGDLGLWPVDWDVDLVTLRQDVYDWLRDHRDVKIVTRIVRLPNPGGDLSDIRARMRALRSREGLETYKSRIGKELAVVDEDGEPTEPMVELTEGLEEGDVELRMEARSSGHDLSPVFNSLERSHFTIAQSWEDDLSGMQTVLETLIEFSASREDGPESED